MVFIAPKAWFHGYDGNAEPPIYGKDETAISSVEVTLNQYTAKTEPRHWMDGFVASPLTLEQTSRYYLSWFLARILRRPRQTIGLGKVRCQCSVESAG
jgi:hypothetical protein